MLPMRPGQVERHTHDYKRNGTLSLFAALEVGSGTVTHETRARHTGADFLAFLRRLAREYPRGEVHVILDNVSTHKTPAVVNWLAGHPRFTFHFTPTSASLHELGRDMVRDPHPPGHPPGQLRERPGLDRRDRALHS